MLLTVLKVYSDIFWMAHVRAYQYPEKKLSPHTRKKTFYRLAMAISFNFLFPGAGPFTGHAYEGQYNNK
jgi:hypothetical protein